MDDRQNIDEMQSMDDRQSLGERQSDGQGKNERQGMDERQEKLSRYISYLLRHHPESAGINTDGEGWADVDELIAGMRKTGREIDLPLLEKIVREDEKGRYSFSEDRSRIRANQGHSFPVRIAMMPAAPPETLYHGTAQKFAARIKNEGICKMSRQYVHLSPDPQTAARVGARHGEPCVFAVSAGKMSRDGYAFYLSENGVWQTDEVPPAYLKIYSL